MAQVFISYNRHSETMASMLADDIEKLGYSVWLDHELSGGQTWWDQILATVRSCDVFVFALSPDALESTACKREFGYAAKLGKPILPVLIADGVSIEVLPPALSEIQFVDYRKQDRVAGLSLARAFAKLRPAKPMPDPLPEPPAAPISYLGSLTEQVDKPALSRQEQSVLVADLTRSMRDSTNTSDVLLLLQKLRRRQDLFAPIGDDIDEVLKSAKRALPDSPRSNEPEVSYSEESQRTQPPPDIPQPPTVDDEMMIHWQLSWPARLRVSLILAAAGIIAGFIVYFLTPSNVSVYLGILPFIAGGAIAGAISGLRPRRIIGALMGMGIGIAPFAAMSLSSYRFVMLVGISVSPLGALAVVLTEIVLETVSRADKLRRPGAIDITVSNGMDTQEGFIVLLDSQEVRTMRGTRYQIAKVSPGRHQIEVTGVIDDIQLEASELVDVPPGEIVKVTLTLPVRENRASAEPAAANPGQWEPVVDDDATEPAGDPG